MELFCILTGKYPVKCMKLFYFNTNYSVMYLKWVLADGKDPVQDQAISHKLYIFSPQSSGSHANVM